MDNYTVNQRVTELIEYLKKFGIIKNNQEFCNICGINKSVLSELLSQKYNVSNKYVWKILTNFPEVNAEWLLTGEGEMLKDNSQNIINSTAGRDIVQTQNAKNTELTEMLKEQINILQQQIKEKDEQIKAKDEQIKVLLNLLNK